MNAWWQHFLISLRLNARNPMALLYGYAFPLIFLAAFRVLYRHETVPLLNHLGQLLTVTVLGGACFGLPTALVSERERGVWRRYRLTPMPTWSLIASVAATRYVVILSAALLQILIALALGMTAPDHPLALWAAFTCTAFSFIGLGLVLAMLANTVPAVQALGQCIFLPMLIIGGIAVPLESLPEWARHVSAFFPGRYAVDSLQAAVTDGSAASTQFALVALLVTGITGFGASALLFRWDAGPRSLGLRHRLGVILFLLAWLGVGVVANLPRDPAATSLAAPLTSETPRPAPAAEHLSRVEPIPAWRQLTSADAAALNFDAVSPDDSVVNPMADPAEESALGYIKEDLEAIHAQLPTWAPGKDRDQLQAIRNLLCLAGAADVLQLPIESHLPAIILHHLEEDFSRADLVAALTWIATHENEGEIIVDYTVIGLPHRINQPQAIRLRVTGYAIKFVGRLIGQLPREQPVASDR